jgi:1,5-anhydro-D-fructose reductase (1,5-anhydro-D-mannitol-forming)
MLRVGIIGLGFIGQVHYHGYRALKDEVKLAAVCDIDQSRLRDAGGISGNIGGAQNKLELEDVALYTDFSKMLHEQKLDIVSVCLPSYLHAQYAIQALEAGVNVLCEKPMAMTLEECDSIIAAANTSGCRLQVGHVLRFWPEYEWTHEAFFDGRFGKLLAAHFQRLSQTPTWSSCNWLMNGELSGGASFDLHIHDVDYVQYLLGLPRAVFSRGYIGPSDDIDHIATQYLYQGDVVVTSEGGWVMTRNFGFRQGFDLVLEEASIVFDSTRTPTLQVYPRNGDPYTPEIAQGDAYTREIAHFVHLVAGQNLLEVITPYESRESVRLVLAEKQSALTKRTVSLG